MGVLVGSRGPGFLLALVQQVARSVRAAAQVAWGPQRRYVALWALMLFLILFALRGGLTPSPPDLNWPWPVGSVHAGQTSEPYLFIVIHPRWLLTFQPYTMLRWAGLAGLVAWAAGVLRQSACCHRAANRKQGWTPGVLGGLLGVVGAGACCGTALPVLAGLAGLGALAPAMDGLTALAMSAVILFQGRKLVEQR